MTMKTTQDLCCAHGTIPAGTPCRRATPEEIDALDPRTRLYAWPDDIAVVIDGAPRVLLVHPSAVAS